VPIVSLPRGRSVPWSVGRRVVADILHFGRDIPRVTVERTVRIPEVAAARLAADPRPGWYPVLLKGFALAAMAVPDLRRSLFTFPHTRLHEHACTVAAVSAERDLPDGPAVLVFHVRQPEITPLTEIAAKFHRAKSAPVAGLGEYRRLIRLARLPRPLRRLAWWLALRVFPRWREKYCGTFGVTSSLSAGGSIITPIAPLSVLWTFGPVGEDGSVVLRVTFDHRVMDGVAASRGLVAAEAALRGPIREELRALARPLRAAV
jgi:hypothetical protein